MKQSYYSYRLFHFMLLTFIAFHMAISSPGWTSTGNEFLNPSNEFFLGMNILVLIFTVISFLKPDRIIYLVLAIGCLILVKLDALPMVPNHIVFALLVFFTLLTGLLLYWDKNLSLKERLATWYEKTAPFVRVELLILYFFVVFHKMNYDYFNVNVSCGAQLYEEIAAVYPFFPTGGWTSTLSLWSAFGFELVIPLFLFFRRTRTFAIVLGLFFHLLLSFHTELYILSFSAEMYALYVLFLPSDLAEKLWMEARDLLQTPRVRKTLLFGTVSVLAAVTVYLLASIPAAGLRESFADMLDLVQTFWFFWVILLTAGYITAARPWFFKPAESGIFRLRTSPLLLFILLVVFNGFTPYLGLKTSTNFAMFSNLKVDGNENNHWFMTSEFQLAGYQNDTVTIVESSHPYLQNFIEWNERLPFFELKKFLSQHQEEEIRVTYRRNGELHTVKLPEDREHEAATAPVWLADKLLLFRGIPQEGPTPCQW